MKSRLFLLCVQITCVALLASCSSTQTKNITSKKLSPSYMKISEIEHGESSPIDGTWESPDDSIYKIDKGKMYLVKKGTKKNNPESPAKRLFKPYEPIGVTVGDVIARNIKSELGKPGRFNCEMARVSANNQVIYDEAMLMIKPMSTQMLFFSMKFGVMLEKISIVNQASYDLEVENLRNMTKKTKSDLDKSKSILQKYSIGNTTEEQFLADGWNCQGPSEGEIGLIYINKNSEINTYILGLFSKGLDRGVMKDLIDMCDIAYKLNEINMNISAPSNAYKQVCKLIFDNGILKTVSWY